MGGVGGTTCGLSSNDIPGSWIFSVGVDAEDVCKKLRRGWEYSTPPPVARGLTVSLAHHCPLKPSGSPDSCRCDQLLGEREGLECEQHMTWVEWHVTNSGGCMSPLNTRQKNSPCTESAAHCKAVLVEIAHTFGEG